MNEFAPYVMQAPALKRRTRQRFTEFDYRSDITSNLNVGQSLSTGLLMQQGVIISEFILQATK